MLRPVPISTESTFWVLENDLNPINITLIISRVKYMLQVMNKNKKLKIESLINSQVIWISVSG